MWAWVIGVLGGALHPPTTYPGAGPRYYVLPRVDTPAVGVSPWTGLARLNVVHEHRVDIDGWADLFPDEPTGPAAASVLLAQPMPWEFPTRMIDLVEALNARGVSKRELFLVLQAAAWQNEEEAPLYVLIGTPMRGIRGSEELKQHLTAWRIEPAFAKGLRLIANKYSDDERIREIGEEIEHIMFDWAEKTKGELLNKINEAGYELGLDLNVISIGRKQVVTIGRWLTKSEAKKLTDLASDDGWAPNAKPLRAKT